MMPVVDCNDPIQWSRMYDPPFTREFAREHFGDGCWVGRNLRVALGITSSMAVILVGSAYGWIAEEWLAALPGLKLACIDTGTYIQGNKLNNATLTINNIDVSGPTNSTRNQLRQIVNSTTIDLIVSEDVLPCYSDAECISLANAARRFAPLAHMVSIRTVSGLARIPEMNWKTIEEWKALLPLDRFVVRGSDVVA